MGWGTPNLAEGADYTMVRLSYDYWLLITLYRNHWISRRIVDMAAQDMVRAWPRLTSDLEPKDLTRLDRALRITRSKAQIEQAVKMSRLFGGAGCLIVIDGHENRLDEPLDLEDVELGSFKGLLPFERWTGIMPDAELETDITKPREFNLPKSYTVGAAGGDRFHVHASRILRFLGPMVPDPEYAAQMYWGISALEPAYEEIRKRDNMSWNILGLTFRAQLIGMKWPELAQMLSGVGMSQNAAKAFYQRMEAVCHLMSNQSLMILPENGDMSSINYTFSGLADVYQQFQLDIAGATGYSVTRLFGRTITGLGQSNDAEEKLYEERIATDQSDNLEPQLEKLYAVLCQSELGEVPQDLDFNFPSIRVMSEQERADAASKVSANIVALVNASVIDRPMALKELKQSSDATNFGTNITDEDIEKAADDEAMGMGIPREGETGNPKIPGQESEGGAEPDMDGLRDVARAMDSARVSRTKPAVERLRFAGFPVAVEYPKRARRTLRNQDGAVVYDRRMANPYGYLENTRGKDGDEVDVILGPLEDSATVWVADMRDLGPDVDFREDEDKVLLGFVDESQARQAFLSMYPPEFLRGMNEMSSEEFGRWLMEYKVAPDGKGFFRRALDWLRDEFREEEHPRGKGEKGGQFVAKGQQGTASAEPEEEVVFEVSDRVRRAIENQNVARAGEQRLADDQERKLSAAVGLPRTANNSAFDLRSDDCGVECKTFISGKNSKVTMSKAALGRKLAEAEAEGLRTYTVVADMRGGRSAARYYVREGLGSFRLASMQPATLAEIRKMVRA
jgi:hypothetical protein